MIRGIRVSQTTWAISPRASQLLTAAARTQMTKGGGLTSASSWQRFISNERSIVSKRAGRRS
jgi:hypothetical protein